MKYTEGPEPNAQLAINSEEGKELGGDGDKKKEA